jgi:hypothetical protein
VGVPQGGVRVDIISDDVRKAEVTGTEKLTGSSRTSLIV